MKKQFFIFISLLFSGLCAAQTETLDGKWEGVITLDTSGFQQVQVINFTVQLRQSGKAAWGIYTRGNDTVRKIAECTGKLIIRLKDENEIIRIYQDGVEANRIAYDLCMYMNFLDAVYLRNDDNEELLQGRWFGDTGNKAGVDGAAGRFYLKKIKTSTDIDVDKYFPRLARIIRRYNR